MPAQMLGLVERALDRIAFKGDIAQMQEMDPVTKPFHHAGQIIVWPRAQRARTQGDAIGRNVDLIMRYL